MRYFLLQHWGVKTEQSLTNPVLRLSFGVIEASRNSLLITFAGLPESLSASLGRAAIEAVDIASITVAAEHDLATTASTIVDTGRDLHLPVCKKKQWTNYTVAVDACPTCQTRTGKRYR